MKNSLKSIIDGFFLQKELAVVALVLFVLGMMIIPIPHDLMDVFIATSIAFSIMVLMLVIYIDTPLKLTSFPSILLLLAMLRIGITVSTSRLILLDANAGKIVSTFGEFVAGGNLVVGVIIFTIITIINFIVITKGSERVAEVAARFSLDGLPGRQMSIDSDLRAGNITIEQANVQRKELGLISQLYGAMDGSIKFVKGDAIASIIDILVNLVGGLIVGVWQHGMSLGDAASAYSILTIGDGLVQQVPALIISISAGMLITRVNEDGEKKSLGATIFAQAFHNVKTMYASALMLFVVSFVPGMPSPVFIGIATVLVIGASVISRRNKKELAGKDNQNKVEVIEEELGKGDNKMQSFNWKLSPLILHVAANLNNSEHARVLKSCLNKIQQNILMDLGVMVPKIILRYVNNVADNSYEILLFEVPIAHGMIHPKSMLLLESQPEIIEGLGITSYVNNDINFGQSTMGIWVPHGSIPSTEGVVTLTLEEFIYAHIYYVVKQHVAEFVGLQEAKDLLDTQEKEYQDLIRELLRMLPLNKITELFQRLVSEEISLRNFKVILDTTLEYAQREKDVILIVEHIRRALGRYIAYKWSRGTKVIPTFMLSQDIEDMTRDAIRYNESGSYLALDPRVETKIISALRKLYDDNKCGAMRVPPVVITHMDIRRYVRHVVVKELDFIPVLSFEELEGYVKFTPLGVVELEDYSDFDMDDDDIMTSNTF